MTNLTRIQEILAEMAAREQAATAGEWKFFCDQNVPRISLKRLDTFNDRICEMIGSAFRSDQTINDGDFIAHVRTTEPRVRRALEVAVEYIDAICGHDIPRPEECGACSKLTEILAALEGKS